MQPRTLEINAWLSEKKCRAVVANLTKKHFKATYCATAQEAADYILAEAKPAHSIGFGGSLSVASAGKGQGATFTLLLDPAGSVEDPTLWLPS